MTTNPTPQTRTAAIYAVLASRPNEVLSPADILRAVPPSVATTTQQVQTALLSIGRSPARYRNLHRIGRGKYLYSEDRPGARQWQQFRRTKKKAVKPAVKKPQVVEAKGTVPGVVPSGLLRPVSDVVVMRDSTGKLFMVQSV